MPDTFHNGALHNDEQEQAARAMTSSLARLGVFLYALSDERDEHAVELRRNPIVAQFLHDIYEIMRT